ncbi:MAG: CaiB/BaiF CoA transferase family protein [Alphaproteobacteria bacterium]
MSGIGSPALEGMRIVDLATVVAAPAVAEMLGDFGAEVIKVEPPKGDEARRMGGHFHGINRNKRGMALDLAGPEGREVLMRLLDWTDVLVENFKPGTMEKWGIGYADFLEARFPRLIHCRVSGFGSNGPYSRFPGYDGVGQAFGGLMSINGERDGPPMRIGLPLADMMAGALATNAVLIAYVERQRSGRGQFLDISLMDAAMVQARPAVPDWLLTGKRPQRWGSRHVFAAPHDVFPTRDGHLFLTGAMDPQFRRTCEVLGRPDIADDPRFATMAMRHDNVDALNALLAEIFADWDSVPLAEALLEANVPAGAVLELPEAYQHPQARARDMLIETADGYRGIGNPVKLSRTPMSVDRPPPAFGQHGREILGELGYTDEEVARLIETGTVPEAPTA